MKRFSYLAKDKNGKTVRGRVEAANAQEAAKLLIDRGLIVLKVSPEREFSLTSIIKKATNKVALADVAILTRQFSTMVSAGLPITDALIIIRTQSKESLKPIVGQILADIEGGSSLANAMERHPAVFSKVYVSLVRAGEAGGVLDKILARLADNLENQREFQSKVKGALIYPVIVVIGMIGVGVVMMVLVLPKIMSIYKDFNVELPLPTRIVMKMSDISVKFWWLLPVVGFGASWAYKTFVKTESGRVKVDRLKLKMPISGNMQKQIMIAEFARTLGLLVGAGIPILQGLKVVSEAVGNAFIRKAIERASEKVEKGFALSYALSQESEVFPPMLYQLLAVGEETGKIDETFLQVSRVFEQESGYAVKNLTAAIEPIIMIILGLGVAFLVVAVILPIFSLTQQF